MNDKPDDAQATPDQLVAQARRLGLIDNPDPTPIACTLDGGIDAMRTRGGDWQRVIGRATGRYPIDHGVTLTYDHDEPLTTELARLAAAEFACCSFFEFTLRVGAGGVTFTVTAPAEAGGIVTAMFGAYGSPAPDVA
jgi:hypothetical protein